MTVVVTPVRGFVAVTVTPGMKAWLASWTNPPTDAFPLCAKALVETTQQRIRHNTDANIPFILPPLKSRTVISKKRRYASSCFILRGAMNLNSQENAMKRIALGL